MKSIIQKSHITKLIEQRNGYLVLSSGLLFLCILLCSLVFYTSSHERTVIVPPTIERSFWVTNQAVSSEYLSEMSLFFANLRLNLTPANADSQRTILLRYTDPSFYGFLNNVLVAERDRITQQHVNTAFYPSDVQVDAKSLTALITGDLYSGVGTTQLAPQRVVYEMKFTYHQGRLLVSRFKEVKSNA